MMNFNNKKTQKIVARVICGLIVLAMIATMLTGLVSSF